MSRAAAVVLAAGWVGWTGCALEVPTADWQLPAERLAPLEIESVLEPSALPQVGPSLRVVTFNVEFGEDVEALATLFSSPPFDVADLFLVQEIEDHDAEPSSRASRLATATGMAFVYLPAKTISGGTQGVAIFSRRSLANVRFMNLPFFRTSIRDDHRVALAAEIDGIDIVNLHLFLQLGIAERILQLGPATQELAPVALIGGDFNTNPYAWSDMLPVIVTDPITNVDVARIVDDAMGEFGFDAATRDSGATHHAPGTSFRLDSIYTRGFEFGAPEVERSVSLSDHWPLWVDIDR